MAPFWKDPNQTTTGQTIIYGSQTESLKNKIKGSYLQNVHNFLGASKNVTKNHFLAVSTREFAFFWFQIGFLFSNASDAIEDFGFKKKVLRDRSKSVSNADASPEKNYGCTLFFSCLHFLKMSEMVMMMSCSPRHRLWNGWGKWVG